MAELPILYADEAEIATRRAAYETRLRELHDDVMRHATPKDFANGMARHRPFYLAYQGLNDRPLQTLYELMACRIMADGHPPASLAPAPLLGPAGARGLRERVLPPAFCLARSRSRAGSASSTAAGFASLAITPAASHAETEIAAAMCERFVCGPLSVEQWRAAILADAPHVLIYPEIGMDGPTAQLARGAPGLVQCTSWGHPDTSGFPTLDYFFSSDLMEPAAGQDHYSETLIRLPNLSTYYELPEPLDYCFVGRTAIAPERDRVLRQLLFKYLPQHDQAFSRIAREVPDSQFVFIEFKSLTDVFTRRLTPPSPPSACVRPTIGVVLPRLRQRQFLAAIGRCDIVVYSIGWSGCNTTLETMLHDLPIVTTPGEPMRAVKQRRLSRDDGRTGNDRCDVGR